ncbi:unnamed protein product [Adineta steineri]|uniref:Uncharacterized protein n=2 Tax=Adineta steineri TaxID=433720 RepID=A0A818HEG0_9BILA|nr:unnamed protein product [Adineta steineri]
MSSTIIPFSTAEELYSKIQTYQTLQCQQRLFHMDTDETKQCPTLLGLQRATTELFTKFINSSEVKSNYVKIEERTCWREFLQNSFVIVAQPSTPECVAATKYEKSESTYNVKLNSRIICLLDADKIQAHFTFSTVDVTLFSLDRHDGEQGEMQPVLEWKTKTIFDAKGQPKLVYYVELQSIRLTKPNSRSARPLYNSKLCRLQFQMKITINDLNIEESLTFLSRPFGVCSHAQYFPEYVAKVLIYEIQQIPQHFGHTIPPDIITDFICRYHTRITGVEPKLHTKRYILQQLQAIYESQKDTINVPSNDIYEEILAKLISQIEFFVDHPYLSMMYEDSLFLGICDNTIDEEINGTWEQMYILLRFNTLEEQQSTQQASVRYIVHNVGELVKATFHSKAFVDDMCGMIFESKSEKAKISRIVSNIPNRSFFDFSLYFDDELYRLSSDTSPIKQTYKPLIPVLWSTMRSIPDNQSKQLSSNSSSNKYKLATSHVASLGEMQTSLSNLSVLTKNPNGLNKQVIIETDKLINYLAEKLPEISVKIEPDETLSISSNVTNENVKKRKLILSNLIHDYIQTISPV